MIDLDVLSPRQQAIVVFCRDHIRYYNLIKEGKWRVADRGYSLYRMVNTVEGLLLNAKDELMPDDFRQLLQEARVGIGGLRVFQDE